MSLRSWKVLASEYLITDPWMTVRSDRCETDQGVLVDSYYVQESCDWVHVVAINDRNEILLTRQYRHAVGEILYELPAGCVENSESPLQAMQRELLEETGCVAERYDMLPPLRPNPARYSNFIHPFIAYGTRMVTVPRQDATEHIASAFVPAAALLSMIDSGEFCAALHVSAVYMALQRVGLLHYKTNTG